MKILIILVILILSINYTVTVKAIGIKDYRFVDRIKIGMKISLAIDLAKKKHFVEKTEIPGYEGDVKQYEYIVYKNKSKRVALYSFNAGYDNETKDKVFRIAIKNPKYITVDGIIVGMTVKDLKARTHLKSADFNYENGFFISSDKFDGGYLMNITLLVDTNYNYEQPKILTLPSKMVIKEIVIF